MSRPGWLYARFLNNSGRFSCHSLRAGLLGAATQFLPVVLAVAPKQPIGVGAGSAGSIEIRLGPAPIQFAACPARPGFAGAGTGVQARRPRAAVPPKRHLCAQRRPCWPVGWARLARCCAL